MEGSKEKFQLDVEENTVSSLRMMYEEHTKQARFHLDLRDKARAATGWMCAALTTAALGLYKLLGILEILIVLGLCVSFLGCLGATLSWYHFQSDRKHVQIARAYRKALERMLFNHESPFVEGGEDSRKKISRVMKVIADSKCISSKRELRRFFERLNVKAADGVRWWEDIQEKLEEEAKAKRDKEVEDVKADKNLLERLREMIELSGETFDESKPRSEMGIAGLKGLLALGPPVDFAKELKKRLDSLSEKIDPRDTSALRDYGDARSKLKTMSKSHTELSKDLANQWNIFSLGFVLAGLFLIVLFFAEKDKFSAPKPENPCCCCKPIEAQE